MWNLSFVKSGRFDFTDFEVSVSQAVELCNRMIDKNKYPNQMFRKQSLRDRKIGIGVMGYADMIIKFGLRYGRNNALEYTDKLVKNLQSYAKNASKVREDKDYYINQLK